MLKMQKSAASVLPFPARKIFCVPVILSGAAFRWRTNKVISGILQGWHRTVEFDTLEYHDDTENFYFTEGTCIMPFGTRVGDSVDPDSLQLVRIRPGTQVEVKAGKLHYVPIPLGDTFRAYVFTPLQESKFVQLPELLIGE